MPLPSKRPVEKLTPADRERFEEKRGDLEDQLRIIKSGESQAAESLSRSVVERDLAKTSKLLEQDEEAIARGREKDKIAREAKELEAELREAMPSHNDMWPTRLGTMESERAVQRQMAFESKYGEKARRWQNLQRRLEPEDPFASSLERIRRER